MAEEIKKKEFLEDILQYHYNDKSIQITNFEVKSGIGKGENYGSVLLRAQINWKNGEKQTGEEKLVIKAPPELQSFTENKDQSLIFHNENFYYKTIVPLYKSILKSKGIDYKGKIAPNSIQCEHSEFVLLEDLAPLGYRLGDRHKGGSFEEAVLVLQALARNHALSISVSRKNPGFFDDNLKRSLWSGSIAFQRLFVIPYKEQCELLEEWPEFKEFHGRLPQMEVSEVLQYFYKGQLKAICQGDCWMNNVLFRYDGTKPVDACLIDYQIIRWGPLVYDILFFMYSSVSPDVLEKNKQDLFNIYINEFLKWMNDLKEDLGEYTKENILNDFKQMQFVGVIIVVAFLYFIIADSSDALEMNQFNTKENEMKRRELRNKPLYKQKLLKHLQIFANEKII